MFETFIRASDTFTDKERHVPAPYIRRAFELDFLPDTAHLFIATAGFYELFVNGEKITKGYLAPYISNPNDFICYDEYDVRALLRKGKNAIGIILGNGFANQSVYQWDFAAADFRAPLSVSVELDIKGDGKEFRLSSDESFRTAPSPITYDMYRYGTHYDARCEIDGWCDAEFDDSAWSGVFLAQPPKGEIIKCGAEPIRATAQIKPVSIRKVENFCYLKTAYRGGEDVEFSRVSSGYLYDFGEDHSGVCRLNISGKPGQKITLRHTERLDEEGNFNLNCIYTYDKKYIDFIPNYQTDVYILGEDACRDYEPSFTYHCFRYVLVEGIEDEQATDELITMTVFNSDVKRRSSFECSCDTMNKLYAMGINADLSNFHYFPTDCPHREKNGWTGDVTASAEQLLLSLNAKRSLRLWLKSMRHAQKESGMLPGIVPTTGWGYTWGNGPFWDACAICLPYYIYKYDGEKDILAENAEMMHRYLKYVASRRDSQGLIAVGLGDWVQPKRAELGLLSPLALTDSATIYNAALKAAFIFDVLGHNEWRDHALSLADELRTAIRKNLISFDAMTAAGDCQTSQSLLLYLGIFEPDEEARAYSRLIDIIKRDGGHLMCGVIGLRYIFEVLIRGGDADLAYKMITRKDAPSYGAMIESGATALCESLIENGCQESQNHHFFGDIIRVFISLIAGLSINPSVQNKNELLFEPHLISKLDRACAEYDFEAGKAFGGWERTADGVKLFVTLPEGVCGTVRYGSLSAELVCGYNEFTAREDR